jgi:hypothetical protein
MWQILGEGPEDSFDLAAPGLSPIWASSSGVQCCLVSRRLGSPAWASSRRTLASAVARRGAPRGAAGGP